MALNRFYLTENSIAQRSDLCIFISHQKRDADTAKKIADYFITSGIDVYFDEYDTTVHFISEEELKRDHSGIPHGGFVIRTGKTGWNDETSHVIEYSLKLDSNPEFTSSVLVAYARVAYRMNKEGRSGAKTVFDVAPAYLCAADGAELRKHLL